MFQSHLIFATELNSHLMDKTKYWYLAQATGDYETNNCLSMTPLFGLLSVRLTGKIVTRCLDPSKTPETLTWSHPDAGTYEMVRKNITRMDTTISAGYADVSGAALVALTLISVFATSI